MNGFDDAWKEAEAAIPEAAARYMALDTDADWSGTRWALLLYSGSVSIDGKQTTRPWASVVDLETGEVPMSGAYGDTPEAALGALVAQLREKSRPSSLSAVPGTETEPENAKAAASTAVGRDVR